MFSRNSSLALVAVLAIWGVALGYSRIGATTATQPALGVRDGQATTVEAIPKGHSVVIPKVDWKTGKKWPGAWAEYPADDVLPHGLKIEITAGVITGIATVDGDTTDYDILGTRYIVGDLDATDITPALWRLFDLEMPKPDGSIAKLSVVRPLWWRQETGAQVGGTIDLAMQEIGLRQGQGAQGWCVQCRFPRQRAGCADRHGQN